MSPVESPIASPAVEPTQGESDELKRPSTSPVESPIAPAVPGPTQGESDALKRPSSAVTCEVIASPDSPSKKRCRLTLPVDDDSKTHEENATVDVDISSLLSKMLSGRSCLLTPDEMRLACHIKPLLGAILHYTLNSTPLAASKNLPPLKIDRHDKGWCHPWNTAECYETLSAGAGHIIISVNFTCINFLNCSDKKEFSWTSICNMYRQLFADGPAPFPDPLPCWLPAGVASLQTIGELLPPASLNLMMPNELAAACALSMFMHPSADWEPFIRGTPVHIYAGDVDQRATRMNRQFQSSLDISSLAENLQLTAVEQGDVIMEQKRALEVLDKPVQRGSKLANVNFEKLARHYKTLKCSEKHPMGSERLVRALLKIGTAFEHDEVTREVLSRMEVRHGRDKDNLHMSPYKLETVPQAIPETYRHLIPEVIASVDMMVDRNQFIGISCLSKVTVVGLTGKNKRKGQEQTADDIGILSLALCRILIRIFTLSRFQSKVDNRLLQLFQNVIECEANFPSEKTLIQFAAVGRSPSTGLGWLENLPYAQSLLKTWFIDLFEGEFNDFIRQGIATSGTVEPLRVIEAVEDFRNVWVALGDAFAERPQQAQQTRAIVPAGETAVDGLDKETPLFPSGSFFDSFHEDQGACGDDDEDGERQKHALRPKLMMKAASKRRETQNFLILSPTATKLQLLQAVTESQVFKNVEGKFGESYCIVLVDPLCAPETQFPTKVVPNKKSAAGYLVPRVQAAMNLVALTKGMVSCCWAVFFFPNIYWLDSVARAEQTVLIQREKKESIDLGFHQRHICATYKHGALPHRKGFAGTIDWEILELVAASDFAAVKAHVRDDGRKSDSCVFAEQDVRAPADSPTLSLDLKKKIWPGCTIDDATLQPSSRSFAKTVDPRWRNKLALQFMCRKGDALPKLIKDFKPGTVKLVINLTPGDGFVSTVLMDMEASDPNAKLLVLNVCNSTDHVAFIESVLDSHVLRAMRTPGHRYHDDELEASVIEAYPNLLQLAASDGTPEPDGADAQEVAAEANDNNNPPDFEDEDDAAVLAAEAVVD